MFSRHSPITCCKSSSSSQWTLQAGSSTIPNVWRCLFSLVLYCTSSSILTAAGLLRNKWHCLSPGESLQFLTYSSSSCFWCSKEEILHSSGILNIPTKNRIKWGWKQVNSLKLRTSKYHLDSIIQYVLGGNIQGFWSTIVHMAQEIILAIRLLWFDEKINLEGFLNYLKVNLRNMYCKSTSRRPNKR